MKRRGRILIADASSAVLLFERLLLAGRFDVTAARDGAQVIAWALAQRPDLILMEAALPYLSGTAAALTIRSHQHLRSIPIIIVKTRDEEACECDDSLRKPINAQELIAKVDRLLGPPHDRA